MKIIIIKPGPAFSTLLFLLGAILICPIHCREKNPAKELPLICAPDFFEIIGNLTPIDPHEFYDSASIPHDISANGLRVVGESRANEPYELYDGQSGYRHCAEAFGWTRHCGQNPFYFSPKFYFPPKKGRSGIIPFGYLPNSTSSHTESYAFGISPDGKVSVGYNTYGFPEPSEERYKARPVVFLQDGVYPLALLDTNTVAEDISQSGAPKPNPKSYRPGQNHDLNGRIIVGWSSNYDKEPSVRPCRAVFWDNAGHVIPLPLPARINANNSPIISSEALCISDDGSTIGGNLFYDYLFDDYHFASVPCIWKRVMTSDGSLSYEPTQLADLDNGDINARINHISGDGKVVVGYGNEDATTDSCASGAYNYKACYWDYTASWSGAHPLGNLTGSKASTANGVNYNGTAIVGSCVNVVGPCDNLDFQSKACIWRKLPSRIVVDDLNVLLGAIVPNNWNLYNAVRISANGKIVTGYRYVTETDKEVGWVVGIPDQPLSQNH